MPPHDSSQAVRSTSPRAAAAVAAAGVAILLLLSLAPPQRVLSRSGHGDVAEYFRYAQRTFDGQIPYRDFRLEYPPGALPVLLAAGPANHGYYNRFRILMLTLGAAAIVLLVAALFSAGANAAELAAGVLVPATLPLTLNPGLVIDRFDLWPTFLMLLAVVGLLRGRRLLSLVALGIGATAKVFPLALVPLALLWRRGGAHVWRDLAVAAAVSLALVLPFALIAPRGVTHVGWLLVRRPLQVESLGASILLASHRFGFYEPTAYYSIGNSWDLAGPAARVVAIVGSLAEAVAVRSRASRAPRATARGRGSRRRLRRLWKDLLAPVHGVGRGGRAARARPDQAVRADGDPRRDPADALCLRLRILRPACGRANELGHARAQPDPRRALLLAAPGARDAESRAGAWAGRRRHDGRL